MLHTLKKHKAIKQPSDSFSCAIKASFQLKKWGLYTLIGVGSIGVADQAMAFNVFKDANNTFSVSGRFAYEYDFNAAGSDHDAHGNSGSRVNIAYDHHFNNGWIAFGRWEEGFDPFYSTSHGDNHFNRYRYLGISHPTYGTLSIGRQNSLLYDFVDVFTDQPWLYADYSETAWSGNDLDGMIERPSDTIKYVVNVDKFTLGAMYGWRRGDIHHTNDYYLDNNKVLARSLTYGNQRKEFEEVGGQYHFTHDLTMGATYHHARIQGSDLEGYRQYNVNAWNTGINWTPGNWFFGADFGQGYHATGPHSKTNNYAAFAAYTQPRLFGDFGDGQLYYDYNLQTDQHSKAKVERNILGMAAMLFQNRLILAVDHMWYNDREPDSARVSNSHPSTGLYVRYNF